jgi:hypothetical protein
MSESVLQSQLGHGERLLWSGRPRQGLFLRPSDAAFIPFSLLWGGFAIFWEASVLNTEAPGFFALWGVPFVAIGLYMIVGRFFVDARQRALTYYGLTNQRIIILSGLFSRSTKSMNLRTLPELSLSESADSRCTISFGSPNPWWAASGMWWPGGGVKAVPTFDNIERAREVYELIRKVQADG